MFLLLFECKLTEGQDPFLDFFHCPASIISSPKGSQIWFFFLGKLYPNFRLEFNPVFWGLFYPENKTKIVQLSLLFPSPLLSPLLALLLPKPSYYLSLPTLGFLSLLLLESSYLLFVRNFRKGLENRGLEDT